MDIVLFFLDFTLHIDDHLEELIAMYGTATHVLLFLVVFFETGIVVTPFLPGDSLLFAAGAFAARDALRIELLFPLLIIAAITGDAVNYLIGARVGPRVFTEGSQFFRQEYLERTKKFYDQHGKKTIILARFIPIVRTFAPFVAGIGKMPYPIFALYNVIGAVVWVSLFLLAGYFFGNIPIVERNFSLVVLAIIALSIAPILIAYFRTFFKERRARRTNALYRDTGRPKDR